MARKESLHQVWVERHSIDPAAADIIRRAEANLQRRDVARLPGQVLRRSVLESTKSERLTGLLVVGVVGLCVGVVVGTNYVTERSEHQSEAKSQAAADLADGVNMALSQSRPYILETLGLCPPELRQAAIAEPLQAATYRLAADNLSRLDPTCLPGQTAVVGVQVELSNGDAVVLHYSDILPPNPS